MKAKVPIVALHLRGKGYDFMQSLRYMQNLDTELETVNPGAPALLRSSMSGLTLLRSSMVVTCGRANSRS